MVYYYALVDGNYFITLGFNITEYVKIFKILTTQKFVLNHCYPIITVTGT